MSTHSFDERPSVKGRHFRPQEGSASNPKPQEQSNSVEGSSASALHESDAQTNAGVERASTKTEGGAGKAKTGGASRLAATVFAVVFFVLLLVHLVCIPLVSGNAQGEKRDLAPWPEPTTEDGTPNLSYLSEAGAWFDDHFAFRPQLVDLDATVKERVLQTSSTSNVIVGRDGWLFYAGTLDDYRRTNPLSDRALDNIACNLALMEEQVRAQGKGFVFTIAPNKNTLYPGQMPYYEMQGQGPSNIERLKPLLEKRGISYVDLAGTLAQQSKVLYLKRDSHWTNEGALMGYAALMQALGREYDDYASHSPVSDSQHVGDLDLMLHPTTAQGEEQLLWEESLRYSYTNEATSVEDSTITTKSEAPRFGGRLMAYRDSFGNALLPYLATQYAEATFTKMVPYNMGASVLAQADDVLVERAERHLSFFNSDPPYLDAPERGAVSAQAQEQTDSRVWMTENGPYLVVEGELEQGYADDGTPIYLVFSLPDGSERSFEAFHVGPAANSTADSVGGDAVETRAITSDWGYRAYISKSVLGGQVPHSVQVVVMHGGVSTSALTSDVELGGAS